MTNALISRTIRITNNNQIKQPNPHKHNQIIIKNIYPKPSQPTFISQIHHHFLNTKVNFCKQKYLPYLLLTTQFNHSK